MTALRENCHCRITGTPVSQSRKRKVAALLLVRLFCNSPKTNTWRGSYWWQCSVGEWEAFILNTLEYPCRYFKREQLYHYTPTGECKLRPTVVYFHLLVTNITRVDVGGKWPLVHRAIMWSEVAPRAPRFVGLPVSSPSCDQSIHVHSQWRLGQSFSQPVCLHTACSKTKLR